MAWTDSHAHLQYDGIGRDAVARARAAGVTRIVCIGTDAAHSSAAIEIAREGGEGLWATVGLHPHEASAGVATLDHLWDSPEVVAVGECGLDYYYDHSPRDAQRAAFAAQIAIAHARELALVIHTREAWDDTFAILDSEGVPVRTIVHCFSGGIPEAQRCLERGAYISFSGIVTFPNASDVRAAASMCPLDRLLVETDAPFLTPVPHRGKPNEPSLVPLVGAAVAAAKEISVAEVEEASWANAEQVLRLVSR